MKKRYTPPLHPSWESQLSDWKLDLLADAEFAEAQASTEQDAAARETLLVYAQQCRDQAASPEKSLREALRGT